MTDWFCTSLSICGRNTIWVRSEWASLGWLSNRKSTRELSRAAFLVLRSKPEGLLVVVTSLFNQLALGVVVFLIANSLDIEIGLGVTLSLFPLAMLLSMLPISLGGWGVREGAMVGSSERLGYPSVRHSQSL